MPTCIVSGQGAGVAAALAASKRVSTQDIDIKELQRALISQGAWIGKKIYNQHRVINSKFK